MALISFGMKIMIFIGIFIFVFRDWFQEKFEWLESITNDRS